MYAVPCAGLRNGLLGDGVALVPGSSQGRPPQNVRVPRGVRFRMAKVHRPMSSLERHGTNPAGDFDPRVAEEGTGVRRALERPPSPRCPEGPSNRFSTGRYCSRTAVRCDFSPVAYICRLSAFSTPPNPSYPLPTRRSAARRDPLRHLIVFFPRSLSPCGIRSLSLSPAGFRSASGWR